MKISYQPLPTTWVRSIRGGAPDANGQKAEPMISNGQGNPCRHCLKDIPEGVPMLALAARPFENLHPYAETGPIFLCAADCDAHTGAEAPEIMTSRDDYLLKGYSQDERIVYGSGAIVPVASVEDFAADLFEQSDIAYIHVRSSRTNCYQLTIKRAEGSDGQADTG